MSKQHNKAKRWRPRFSVRTLAILITVVCCYAACWGPTKRQGVRDAAEKTARFSTGYRSTYSATAPLIVRGREVRLTTSGTLVTFYWTDRYYFWFFGYVAKLPYER
jgi:hypothetical protein